jgi:hypothetical protein
MNDTGFLVITMNPEQDYNSSLLTCGNEASTTIRNWQSIFLLCNKWSGDNSYPHGFWSPRTYHQAGSQFMEFLQSSGQWIRSLMTFNIKQLND